MVTELFRRQRIPELYAALGAVWILVTSLAIPWLSGERLEGAWLEVAKGLGFVGVSALVMRALVAGDSADTTTKHWPRCTSAPARLPLPPTTNSRACCSNPCSSPAG